MKTSMLIGPALDWAVAKCENELWIAYDAALDIALDDEDAPIPPLPSEYLRDYEFHQDGFRPSTDWSQGGPILDREKIAFIYHDNGIVSAIVFRRQTCAIQGPTALIAAMRCYVASKLGDDVKIPEELM